MIHVSIRHWAAQLCLIGAYLFLTACDLTHHKRENSSRSQNEADLPLPSQLLLQDYESLLYRFLMERTYADLHWHHDKEVRDTGPYLENQYFGTHPAVRIYYSPSVIQWLKNDRKGEIPDGAMIIKEMFHPPATLYQELKNNPAYTDDPSQYDDTLNKLIFSWTVMVRDTQASKDGWFWANPGAPQENETVEQAIARQLDTLEGPPGSEFGAPCLRCHASAEKQFTFSALRNIKGFTPDQEPIQFIVDTSWRSQSHFSSYPLSLLADDPFVQTHFMLPNVLRPFSSDNQQGASVDGDFHTGLTRSDQQWHKNEKRATPNKHIVNTFHKNPIEASQVRRFPSQWQDQVLPSPHLSEAFITSDNCMSCHGGLGGEPYGVTMFVSTGPNYGDGYNISEFGEWRWSPMGLAGRDPIFYAQIESEMAYLEQDARRSPSPLVGTLEENKIAVVNTCTSCHGAMGQRQLDLDAQKDPKLDPNFKIEYMYLAPRISSKQAAPPEHLEKYTKYGQLGREGISCTICHRIDKPSDEQIEQWHPPHNYLSDDSDKRLAYSIFFNNTGHFEQGPNDKLYGPIEEVREKPMDHALGMTPVHNEFTSDSLLCGTCHIINLPNIGQPLKQNSVLNSAEQNPAFQHYQHSIEQATFLEWQNSAFAQPSDSFASCQDCHMQKGFETLDGSIQIDNITTQIAAIQDANFPEADHRLPLEDINVPLEPDYRRHEHVGLNVFLLEMFDQFPEVLGVDKSDYMTSAKNGVDTAIDNMIIQARKFTANIDVKIDSLVDRQLTATVQVKNKTGHRYPSGVAFRRAFIELLVLEDEKIIWGSGRTNGAGVIVDENNKPLPSEFLPNKETYQPHYQEITQQNQVQIYEILELDMDKQFTTSFVHRVHHVKDNRLLPDGWRQSTFFKDQGEVMYQFMEATDPIATHADPDYKDQGPGFIGQDRLQYKIKLPSHVDRSKIKVRATLYNQSIPPYWLHQRLKAAPKGEATQRLYYMVSHLDLEGTPMQDWKLKLVSDEAKID